MASGALSPFAIAQQGDLLGKACGDCSGRVITLRYELVQYLLQISTRGPNSVLEQYIQEANAKAATNKAVDGRCGTCGKDVGVDWHYDFESIVFAKTVGIECPEYGLFLCDEHLEFGADGNYKPCPKCNVRMFTLNLGPAYSSMVDQARHERRYRGPIKEPSVLNRTFKIG